MLRARPANVRRAGRARFAPSPTVLRVKARGGARLLARSRSCAFTKLSRQGHFPNIHLQAARASNSQDSNRTKEPKRREIMQRKASAVWQGGLKDGKGSISTDSGVLKQTKYSYSTRFENGVGTNPEELVAAA